jgi:hypothetical protein
LSIIYDALQKIQMTHQKKIDKNYSDKFDTLIIYILVILSTLIIMLEFPIIKAKYLTKPIQLVKKNIVSPKPLKTEMQLVNVEEFKSKYRVNGIFFSNEQKVALINDKFLNIGDKIETFKIVNIYNDHLILKNSHQMITLTIAI